MQEKPIRKLTDDEAYGRLHEALLALGKDDGESVRSDTALKAARRALTGLQMGLVLAAENANDEPQKPPR